MKRGRSSDAEDKTRQEDLKEVFSLPLAELNTPEQARRPRIENIASPSLLRHASSAMIVFKRHHQRQHKLIKHFRHFSLDNVAEGL